MNVIFWDASALVKRFVAEPGSVSVDAVFGYVPLRLMVATFVGYAESVSVLVRKRNRGLLAEPTFEAAFAALQDELVFTPELTVIETTSATIVSAVDLVIRHNVNATDAILLAAYLDYIEHYVSDGTRAILVTSDARLERAARAEGLATINPERISPAEVHATLAGQ